MVIFLIKKIMINGRSLAGKDTIADYLVNKYSFTKLFFAEGIYEIAYKYFGMKEKDRELLQDIGQKMREIKPGIWVDYTYDKAKELDLVVLSDVRQANEYLTGIEEGFFPLRVVANFDLRVQRAIKRDGSYPDTSRWEHKAETGADDFTYFTIENSESLCNLYDKIDFLMEFDASKFIQTLQDKYK